MATFNNGSLGTTYPADGGLIPRPTGDDRRSTLNTNDLRGKILRVKVKDGDITAADANKADPAPAGAYTIPSGNLYPLAGGSADARPVPRSTRWASATRSASRSTRTTSPTCPTTRRTPTRRSAAAGRQASAAWRSCASRPTTAIRSATRASSATTSGSSTSSRPAPRPSARPLNNPPEAVDCGNPAGLVNESRWVRDGGPGFEPGLALTPPVSDPEIWYSYRDNNATAPLGTPCRGYYDTDARADRPGLDDRVPAPVPGAFTGGVAPHGAAKYHYDPANPNTKKFPPVLRQLRDPRASSARTRCARSSSTRRTACSRSTRCWTAVRRGHRRRDPVFEFECDNPMDMQFGKPTARSTC